MPTIARIPITNIYADGDYTGRILVGPKQKPMNVLLDTGSSALALDAKKYKPNLTGEISPKTWPRRILTVTEATGPEQSSQPSYRSARATQRLAFRGETRRSPILPQMICSERPTAFWVLPMLRSTTLLPCRRTRGRINTLRSRFEPVNTARSSRTSTLRLKAMKTHSNGCKPRIAITLSGWNTSPSIRSLIAVAPTLVFKSSSGDRPALN
jgi:hypothetical protein